MPIGSPIPSAGGHREQSWTAPVPPSPGWTQPAFGYLALPHSAPPPPVPPRRRRRRPVLLLGIGCLLAALVCGLLTAAQYRSERSAPAVVRRYFAALAAGDAEAALGFGTTPPKGNYLTGAILRQQLDRAPLADLTVQRTDLAGNRGTVTVRYQLRFGTGVEQRTDVVPVSRHGSSWRLDRVAARVEVAVTSAGADRVTLAGGRLPSAPVLLFPGALPLGTDTSAVAVDGRPALSLSPAQQTSEITVSVTAAARSRLQRSLDRALAGCLAGTAPQANCPQPGDARPVPGSLRGTALPQQQPLQINLALGGRLELSGSVPVRGSWQDWDFNNQAVRRTGDTQLDLHASASAADLDAIYWGSS